MPASSSRFDTPGDGVISVTMLNRMAREKLEQAFPLLWVSGEVSNLTRAASGHLYFSLKDEQAQVRCAMWRNRAQLLPFQISHGMRIEVRALVTLYEPRGDYQLSVEAIRRAGMGNLYEAFLRLKERLTAEGLFDPAAKRALPRFPRSIAVVTSPQAAAWRDVQAALERRAPHLPVALYPTLVQGDAAGGRIADAIRRAGRDAAAAGHDVLLLVRGGGSLEDLWAFNEEVVARAIRACPIPVVSGVGHETDVTIADFAADLRAATPTAAAELASAGFFEARQALAGLRFTLGRAMERRLATMGQRLDRAAVRLIHPRERIARARLTLDALARRLQASPRLQLGLRQTWLASLGLRLRMRRPDLVERGKRLEALSVRLERACDHWLGNQHNRLASLGAHLAHLDPNAVLARGYSIARDAEGRIVRQSSTLAPGAQVRLQFAEGHASATIDRVDD